MTVYTKAALPLFSFVYFRGIALWQILLLGVSCVQFGVNVAIKERRSCEVIKLSSAYNSASTKGVIRICVVVYTHYMLASGCWNVISVSILNFGTSFFSKLRGGKKLFFFEMAGM